jgi:hypothetical protein
VIIIIIIIIINLPPPPSQQVFSECREKFSNVVSRLRGESEQAPPFNVEVKKEWS